MEHCQGRYALLVKFRRDACWDKVTNVALRYNCCYSLNLVTKEHIVQHTALPEYVLDASYLIWSAWKKH